MRDAKTLPPQPNEAQALRDHAQDLYRKAYNMLDTAAALLDIAKRLEDKK